MKKKQLYLSVLAVSLVLTGGTIVGAQQGESPKKRPAPSLATEDVLPITSQIKAEKPAEEVKPADSKAAEDKAADGKTEAKAAEKTAAQPDAEKPKEENPLELVWREQMRQARERVHQLRQQTQETELGLTEVRNNRYLGNQTPNSLNASAVALEQGGEQLTALRAELADAVREMEELAETGKKAEYHEPAPKPNNSKGEPNEAYYKSRYKELLSRLAEAERRVKIYDYRVADIQARMMGNTATTSAKGEKGGGDAYASLRLKQELDQALTDLDLARADLSTAQQALDDLQEEARRAGLPPGIFQ